MLQNHKGHPQNALHLSYRWPTRLHYHMRVNMCECECQTTYGWFLLPVHLLKRMPEDGETVEILVFPLCAQHERQCFVGWMDSRLPNLKCWITGNFSKHWDGRAKRETVLLTWERWGKNMEAIQLQWCEKSIKIILTFKWISVNGASVTVTPLTCFCTM